MGDYQAVKIKKSDDGFGGPLVIEPTEEKNIIASVTGGGIDPVAEKIAEMTGGKAVDGFNNAPPEEDMCCVVIDCGGTARVGVYPKKRIPTINTNAVGKSGPLSEHIKEDIYVSGVNKNNMDKLISYTEEEAKMEAGTETAIDEGSGSGFEQAGDIDVGESSGITGKIASIGQVMGNIVSTFYEAGRKTINQLIENIIPFLAFIATLIGIIRATGLGELISHSLAPLASTLPGLLAMSIIAALPFLSPILGPGAIIAQVVGVIIGTQIAKGNIPPQFALPALFAINPQVGCDFVPVGLSLGEADTQTQQVGVPAVLMSRLITGPVATIIAYVFSFGLY